MTVTVSEQSAETDLTLGKINVSLALAQILAPVRFYTSSSRRARPLSRVRRALPDAVHTFGQLRPSKPGKGCLDGVQRFHSRSRPQTHSWGFLDHHTRLPALCQQTTPLTHTHTHTPRHTQTHTHTLPPERHSRNGCLFMSH